VEAGSQFDAATLGAIAEDVGIGAIKYADLSTALGSAYVFDWDRMISFRGNTGPYLQYAAARIRSIFRRAGLDEGAFASGSGPWGYGGVPRGGTAPGDPAGIQVSEPAERALALKLLGFGATVVHVAETAEPHRLCAYLFDVASSFTAFYEQCPVLKAERDSVRDSRLALSALTLRVLLTGLGLLGVPAPERM
jgi:arginyl-tRNA synthetase